MKVLEGKYTIKQEPFLAYSSESKVNLPYYFTAQMASITLPYTTPIWRSNNRTSTRTLKHQCRINASKYFRRNYTIYIADKS
jgi:hypothetical protein